MNITLKIKNITPLTQIEGNKKERVNFLDNMELDVVTIKTITKLYEGIPVNIPVFTANGFRGLLRRELSSIMVEEYIKKGHSIKPKDFHLMFAGGGSDYQTQPFEIVDEVRRLNPVISLFGTSLAVEGKLMITDLYPVDEMVSAKTDKDGNVYYRSELVKRIIFTKKDDLISQTEYSRLVKKEDIAAWENEVLESQKKRAEERGKDKDLVAEKTKKKAIQAILARYYVIPNTEFKGGIDTKYPLTDIEKGGLIRALMRITNKQLGAVKSLGYGICDYDITIDDESKITARTKDDNLFRKDISYVLSDEAEKYVKAFDDWLEGISPENIEISKVLIGK